MIIKNTLSRNVIIVRYLRDLLSSEAADMRSSEEIQFHWLVLVSNLDNRKIHLKY